MKYLKTFESHSDEWMTLKELYGGNPPDEGEEMWIYLDLETWGEEKFKIITINPVEWYERYKKDYEESISHEDEEDEEDDEFSDEFSDDDGWDGHEAIVSMYRSNIEAALETPIIIEGNSILDGYHRIIALGLENITESKALDLAQQK